MRSFMLSLLTLLPVAARGQALDIQPGARIRITAPGLKLTGNMLSRTDDSIVVATTAGERRLALSGLSDLSVSRGKSHLLGAHKGFVFGAVVTFPVTLLATAGYAMFVDTREGNPDGSQSPHRFAATMMVQAGAVGALIGGAIGKEAWTKQQMPGAGRLSPAVGVAPTGARVGGQFRFR
jgi:hypothetical protein